MNENVSKTIIRIVHDFCFSYSAPILSSEFALSITPLIVKCLRKNTLDLGQLKNIVDSRKDFFIANNIESTEFNKRLFQKLNYELSFYDACDFYDSIITFKRKMENGNFRGFPKDSTSEETLRSALNIYIYEETFCEPRSGSGNNDITVPSERVVIETKLWKGMEYYNSGFPELNDYLDKYNYFEGYYIIFDYNQTPNDAIKENGEIFDTQYDDKLIRVIFVKMNAIRPSKVYSTRKKTQQKNQEH